VSGYDCEAPAIYFERFVRARKEHCCVECKHSIWVGEEYQRVTGLWDGEWATYATCSCCARARCALSGELGFGECVPIGCLAEELEAFEQCRGPLKPIITVPSESIPLG
jgi:hypothetical protein